DLTRPVRVRHVHAHRTAQLARCPLHHLGARLPLRLRSGDIPMTRSLALVALSVALAASRGRGTPADHAQLTPIANHAPAEAPVQAVGETPARRELVRGPSIYDLPVQLVTADGKRVGLDVARGKPV